MESSSGVRMALRLLMLAVFAAWILMWVMRPTSAFPNFWQPFVKHTTTKVFGSAGSFNLLYSVPIVFLAVVGAVYLQLRQRTRNKKGRVLSLNPCTYPVLVRGPLSVASAAELVILVLFVGLLVWTLAQYLVTGFHSINPKKLQKEHLKLWEKKSEVAGVKLGQTGIVCLAFLFFPVARGSVFLRLLNIPFEHSVKYHIWIANIMMGIWTVHGLVYVVYWALSGQMKQLFHWSKTEVSGLSGLIAWKIGMIIWITSLAPVRKHRFELFYYTHQLYILFIVAFTLHVGDKLYYAVFGGIFLFFVSRFIRLLQSRRPVDVLSARMLSSETMEIVIAKHPNLEYNPASFILVKFPAVSPLQWHPFTVVSSSNVDTEHLSLLIKCNGEWTLKLRDHLKMSNADSPLLEAAVEGPYGHTLDYLVMYEVLIFVAGGSGISPFISILNDLLHSIQHKDFPAPKRIVLIWAVKKSDELPILQLVSPASSSPDFNNKLKLDIQAYVTREDGIDLEKMSYNGNNGPSSVNGKMTPSVQSPESHARSISAVDGIQNGLVHAAVVLASFAGFLFLIGLLTRFFVYPMDHDSYEVFPRSVKGLFAFMATAFGITVFGGATILIWSCLRGNGDGAKPNSTQMLSTTSAADSRGLQPSKIHYGRRPDFHAIFSDYAKRLVESEVGVLACGPTKMQQAVALECQARRFSYHPLNYDL